jgi:hypothetical protein
VTSIKGAAVNKTLEGTGLPARRFGKYVVQETLPFF